MTVDILTLLDGKWEDGTRPKDLFEQSISKEPAAYVGKIMEGLLGKVKKAQNGCAELASLTSEAHPALFYPHIQVFIKNLTAKEPILRWEAVCTLGNMAALDAEKRVIVPHIPVILGMLQHQSIVLQGHAVKALCKIARVFGEQAAGIQERLIASPEYFPGNRVGFLVEAMEHFAQDPKLLAKGRAFVKTYVGSDINSVASKAKKVLKKLGA